VTNFAFRVSANLFLEDTEIKKNKEAVKKNFSSEIRNRYAEIMSLELMGGEHRINAVKFANAFNLRAHGTTTISRQTALKWINGKGIPEPGHIYVLRDWLKIDLNQIFGG